MPFVTQDRRDIIDEFGLDNDKLPGGIQVGDRCYVFYKPMVDKWKANPRWTTAHNIYKTMMREIESPESLSEDDGAAYELAWQVFFEIYVMPYELKKREENGDI